MKRRSTTPSTRKSSKTIYFNPLRNHNATSADDDEDEAGCADIDALEEAMKLMFRESRGDEVDDALAFFFNKTTPEINSATFEEIFDLYTTEFIHGWEVAGLMRAEFVTKLYDIFEGDNETAMNVLTQNFKHMIVSDLPFVKKAYARVLAVLAKDKQFDITKFEDVIESYGDTGSKYEAAGAYEALYEALVEECKARELGDDLVKHCEEKVKHYSAEQDRILG